MNGLTVNKSRYRITLEIEAFDDLNPFEINWKDVLNLNPAESVRLVKLEDDSDYMF